MNNTQFFQYLKQFLYNSEQFSNINFQSEKSFQKNLSNIFLNEINEKVWKKSRKIEIQNFFKKIKNKRLSYLIFAWFFPCILNISIEFFHCHNSRVINRTPASDIVCVVFQSRNYFNIDNTEIISIYFDKY